MYRIKYGLQTAYADSVKYIRLHENGSYCITDEANADGFSAKQPVKCTSDDGNEVATLNDVVYVFYGHTMKGTEPIGSFEEVSGALNMNATEQALEEAYELLYGGAV